MTTRKIKKNAAPPMASTAMAFPSGTMITPKAVATDILKCADKTVYELIEKGVLPAYRWSDKPGSAIRVRVDDVYAMLQPVIPEAVMADMRSRQPSPLHVPVSADSAGESQ